jgi:glycosyltransferase involved in cell wall biosynthesis
MKILLVHNTYQYRGGEDVVLDQERQLLKNAGHEVVEYQRHNSEIQQYSTVQKVSLLVRTVWASDSRREFSALLQENKPDIVHIHNTFPLISPSIYWACRSAQVPVVQTLHNYRMFCPQANFFRDGKTCEDCIDGNFWQGVRHGCYRDSRLETAPVALMLWVHHALKTWHRMVDRYIVLTAFSRSRFVNAGLPADKIVVKPNFVPDTGVRTQEGSYALCVGRVSQEKGVTALLKAWRQVPRTYVLRVIGDGPAREQLERDAKADGLSNVTFMGHQPRERVVEAMKGARFVIFPSELYENLPLTILESFACGVPVLASKLGAMQEIVEEGHTGMFFQPGDSEEIARVVSRAWEQPEYMGRLGAQARKEYETKYTAAANYQQLLEIYQDVIARRLRPAEFSSLPILTPAQPPIRVDAGGIDR